MKTMDLNAYGVSEMTHQEMLEIDGGTIWDKIKEAAQAVADWVEGAIDWCNSHCHVGKTATGGFECRCEF